MLAVRLGLTLDPSELSAPLLAALLRKSASSGLAKWAIYPEGRGLEVRTMACLPLTATDDDFHAAALAAAFEVDNFKNEVTR